jgi:hypothetical protein
MGTERPLLRIATINVWGRRGAWNSRRSVLKNGLAQLDADLISFQEAIHTDDYDMVAELLEWATSTCSSLLTRAPGLVQAEFDQPLDQRSR